jgi:hypothetical protein
MKKGEELKVPYYASTVATCDSNLPQLAICNGNLPYIMATCLYSQRLYLSWPSAIYDYSNTGSSFFYSLRQELIKLILKETLLSPYLTIYYCIYKSR